jgi:hypothetical protein
VQFEDDGERLAGGVQAKANDFAAVPGPATEQAKAEGKGAASFF